MDASDGDFKVNGHHKENMHPIFTKDPKKWMELLHSKVCIKTKDFKELTGYVYTVDPVSECIVLFETLGGPLTCSNTSISMIPGESVDNVTVLSKGGAEVRDMFNNLFRPKSDTSYTQEQLNARKHRVKSWIEKHRFPVILGKDNVTLSIADALVIPAPYTAESCLSTNEIILSRIQGLLKAMPNDFDVDQTL